MLYEQNPNIVWLQVHLPGQHLVTYDPTEDPEKIMEHAVSEKTTLSAFFHANANTGALGDAAHRLTYQEFPQHFMYKDNAKMWAVQQKGFAIGHMTYVPPNAGERFYLCTLLTAVKGPTSFPDLHTFEGVEHATFHDACLVCRLLEDDGEW